jgi:DNA-binding transcriptional LysR family regulator
MEQLIDLNHLEIFTKIAELRSFTDVADKMGIPKSTVSRAVLRLEEQIGSQLFYRNTRTVELTALGKSLYANCFGGLIAARAGVTDTLHQSEKYEGTIRITSVDDLGVSLLSSIVAKFCERHPQVNVDIVLGTEVMDMVGQGIDIAVRVGSVNEQNHRQRRVGKICFILVASPRYLEKFDSVLEPKDISHAEFLGFAGFKLAEKGVRLFLKHRKFHLKNIRVRCQSTNTAALLEIVKSGIGIGLLPDFLCLEDIKKETIIPVCRGWHTEPRNVSIVTQSHKVRMPLIKLFTGFLFENLKGKLP